MSAQVWSSGVAARRSSVVAALISIFAPGVGHLYAGRPRRGAALYAAMLAIQAAIVVASVLIPPTFGAVVTFGVVAIAATFGAYLFIIVDATRLARAGSTAAPRWYVYVAAVAAVYLGGEAALVAVPAAAAYRSWHTFSAAASSMEPTLRRGEIFLADTDYFSTNAPSRADVVVYRMPHDPDTIFVKRIVALAGDRIMFRAGHAYINGQPLYEPYARFGNPAAPPNNTTEFTVPAGQVYVAGDNRDNSLDSRSMAEHGPVPVANLVGRATDILLTSLPDRPGLWVGTPR